MSKFHTTNNEWGLVSGIRQARSDLIVVNEPRSPFSPEARKGQLFVVVEAEGDVARGRQACALVAQTICETFYADGSTSITSSLRHALKAANAALYQHNFQAPPHRRALVGATCAVIHGSDLYLTQVPPAQAFLSHTSKLRALPVPLSWTNGAGTSTLTHSGALGTSLGSEPEFLRSVMQPGDTLVICSSNVARLLSKRQAEELVCYSAGPTIAEELYALCRAASLSEAHAIVLEAVAGPAPDDRDSSFTPVAVAERSKQAVERWSGFFGRSAGRSETVSDVPQTGTTVGRAGPMSHEAAPAAAQPGGGAETRALSVMDLLPVADDIPLPPSAFIGEGEYGGLVRPPAVPRRSRQVDLSDNHGTPVDFAAIPRKPPPPPPTIGERLTLPLRMAFAGMMSGIANVPRRTARPAERLPAQGLRLKELSYRKQRPRLPWLNVLLIVGVVALLIAVGMQQNRRRDRDTINVALDKVQTAVSAARDAIDPAVAQAQLASAETALNEDVSALVQSGMITTTKPLVWSRYLDVRNSYDRAMAMINRIGFVDDFETIASLPGGQGLISRLALGTTATISDTVVPVFYLDRSAGVLYERGRPAPLLRPDQEAGSFVTENVREVLWRDAGNSVIALDRGDPTFPVYHVYLPTDTGWLSNQLNQTEHMQPSDRDLPMAAFGGHLYVWDQETKQLWKYASGMYADLPTAWITNAGNVPLDQVVDVQIDGNVYLLNRDGSVLVFTAGALVKQLAPPQLKVPLGGVTRFVVTADELAEDGTTIVRPGFIYILDLRNERILQLSKVDGGLVQQIQARSRGPLNQMADLAVDEARRELYLANGPQVLRAQLPEPPQPEPETTITTTPEP